jgi:hypothetical protein
MNKEPQKELVTKQPADIAPTKKWTEKELREFVISNADSVCNVFEGLTESFNTKGTKKKDEEDRKERVTKAIHAMGLETHEQLATTVIEYYQPLVGEMSRQMIKDYDCKTVAEKALVEIAVNAYIRTIDNSRRLNNELSDTSITATKTNYAKLLSIQIDRANRQFINALITLKQLKAPTIEMNVRANTAFIAQNQQINADNPPKPTNSETNEY